VGRELSFRPGMVMAEKDGLPGSGAFQSGNHFEQVPRWLLPEL